MEWSNTKINKVGDIIRSGRKDEEYFSALNILNSWRESHGAILDEYYSKCQKLARIGVNIIVAQRLKRLPTIIDKLDRQPKMRLSSMQDIAGVRIIVKNMAMLRNIEKRLRRWKFLDGVKDYIANPKQDGYRGIHFIYKKNNRRVEIQLRTELQHLWATSVETTDVFRGASLKTRGDDTYWSKFFALVSSTFALAEKTTPISLFESLSYQESLHELEGIISSRKIIDTLNSMAFVNILSKDVRFRKSHYVLMDLDYKARKCDVFCFQEKYYKEANEKYTQLESDTKRKHNTVLVAVGSFNKLKDAYPNYFVDIRKFADIIMFMLELNKKEFII